MEESASSSSVNKADEATSSNSSDKAGIRRLFKVDKDAKLPGSLVLPERDEPLQPCATSRCDWRNVDMIASCLEVPQEVMKTEYGNQLLRYMLITPKPFRKQRPLVLYLHGGANDWTSPLEDMDDITKEATARDSTDRCDSAPIELCDDWGCNVIVPFCPGQDVDQAWGRLWWFRQGSQKQFEEYKFEEMERSFVIQAACEMLVKKYQEELDPCCFFLTGVSVGGFGAMDWLEHCDIWPLACSAVSPSYGEEDAVSFARVWGEKAQASGDKNRFQIIASPDETDPPGGIYNMIRDWPETYNHPIDLRMDSKHHIGSIRNHTPTIGRFFMDCLELNGIHNAEISLPDEDSPSKETTATSSQDAPPTRFIKTKAWVPRFFFNLDESEQEKYGYDWRKYQDEWEKWASWKKKRGGKKKKKKKGHSDWAETPEQENTANDATSSNQPTAKSSPKKHDRKGKKKHNADDEWWANSDDKKVKAEDADDEWWSKNKSKKNKKQNQGDDWWETSNSKKLTKEEQQAADEEWWAWYEKEEDPKPKQKSNKGKYRTVASNTELVFHPKHHVNYTISNENPLGASRPTSNRTSPAKSRNWSPVKKGDGILGTTPEVWGKEEKSNKSKRNQYASKSAGPSPTPTPRSTGSKPTARRKREQSGPQNRNCPNKKNNQQSGGGKKWKSKDSWEYDKSQDKWEYESESSKRKISFSEAMPLGGRIKSPR